MGTPHPERPQIQGPVAEPLLQRPLPNLFSRLLLPSPRYFSQRAARCTTSRPRRRPSSWLVRGLPSIITSNHLNHKLRQLFDRAYPALKAVICGDPYLISSLSGPRSAMASVGATSRKPSGSPAHSPGQSRSQSPLVSPFFVALMSWTTQEKSNSVYRARPSYFRPDQRRRGSKRVEVHSFLPGGELSGPQHCPFFPSFLASSSSMA